MNLNERMHDITTTAQSIPAEELDDVIHYAVHYYREILAEYAMPDIMSDPDLIELARSHIAPSEGEILRHALHEAYLDRLDEISCGARRCAELIDT